MNHEVAHESTGRFPAFKLKPFNHTVGTPAMAEGAMAGFHMPLMCLFERPDSFVGSLSILESNQRNDPDE